MVKFLILALILIPSFSSAATYYYVATDGETAVIVADSAEDALLFAPDIAPTSGVALDTGFIETGTEVPAVEDSNLGTGGSNTFHYVTVSGVTATVQADNPDRALEIAPQRAPESGVAIDEGVIESGAIVPSVAY